MQRKRDKMSLLPSRCRSVISIFPFTCLIRYSVSHHSFPSFFFSTLLKMKIGREENRTKLVYAKCYESSYTSPLSKSRSKYISRQGFLNNVAKQNSRLFTRCEIDVGRQNMYFVVPLRSNWTTALDVVEYITPKLLLS